MWRCFHCNETFWRRASAAAHFGSSLYDTPVCQIPAEQIRHMESQLTLYREEDTALHRQIYSMQAKHNIDLRREEEKGYARGLADGRALGPDIFL